MGSFIALTMIYVVSSIIIGYVSSDELEIIVGTNIIKIVSNIAYALSVMLCVHELNNAAYLVFLFIPVYIAYFQAEVMRYKRVHNK